MTINLALGSKNLTETYVSVRGTPTQNINNNWERLRTSSEKHSIPYAKNKQTPKAN